MQALDALRRRTAGWSEPAGGNSIWLGLTSLICLTGLWKVVGQPISADVAWFLHVAQRVLDGARLYVDVIEINPPLVAWLSMPAVIVEKVSGLSQTTGPVTIDFVRSLNSSASKARKSSLFQ